MSKAATTRLTILEKAFELIYKKGFQTTSIDDIIATTQVTKGAFFYHFKNKEEMGLAVVEELLHPGMHSMLVKPMLESQKPLEDIYSMMETILMRSPFFQVKYGCPAVNLIDEMSPVNDTFSKALSKLMLQCQEAIEESIRRGKASGQIRADVVPTQVACFVMAGYSGIRNMGKLMGPACYHSYLQALNAYLKSLS